MQAPLSGNRKFIRLVTVTVAIVIACCVGSIVLYQQHQHAVRHDAAVARGMMLKKALADDGNDDKLAEGARARYEAAIALASKAGGMRHDNGISGSQSSSFQAKEARLEQTELKRAEDASAMQMDAIDRSLQIYEDLYGAEGVQSARADAANFREARNLELAEWGNAIQAIVDVYATDNQPNSIAEQSIADHYSKAQESKIHADKYENALLTEQTRLIDRITNDLREIIKQM